MLALPTMLVSPATRAGIKCPSDVENYDVNEFPHFFVYARMQLGTSIPSPNSPWRNAEIIAAISDDKICKVTPKELVDLGFEVGVPIP